MKLGLSAALLCGAGLWGNAAAEVPTEIRQSLQQELQSLGLVGLPAAKVALTPGETAGMYQGVAATYVFDLGPEFSWRSNLFEHELGEQFDDTQRAAARSESLAALDPAWFIYYDPPAGTPVEYQVTVFADVTCPFSRQLHQEVGSLNELGVSLRYLAFPSEGLESIGHKRMQPVWCSPPAERAGVLSAAMQGRKIKLHTCADSVSAQYHLALSLGLEGTPGLVFADGSIYTGYLSAMELLQALEAAALAESPPLLP